MARVLIFFDLLLDHGEVRTIVAELEDLGVMYSSGTVSFTPAGRDTFEKSAWKLDRDEQSLFDATALSLSQESGNKLCARLQRGLDVLEAIRLHQLLDAEAQKRMLSAGGPGTGSFWSERKM